MGEADSGGFKVSHLAVCRGGRQDWASGVCRAANRYAWDRGRHEAAQEGFRGTKICLRLGVRGFRVEVHEVFGLAVRIGGVRWAACLSPTPERVSSFRGVSSAAKEGFYFHASNVDLSLHPSDEDLSPGRAIA